MRRYYVRDVDGNTSILGTYHQMNDKTDCLTIYDKNHKALFIAKDYISVSIEEISGESRGRKQ